MCKKFATAHDAICDRNKSMDIQRRGNQKVAHARDFLPHPTEVVPFGRYGAGLWTGHPIGLVIVVGVLVMGFVGLPELRWFLAGAFPLGCICGFFLSSCRSSRPLTAAAYVPISRLIGKVVPSCRPLASGRQSFRRAGRVTDHFCRLRSRESGTEEDRRLVKPFADVNQNRIAPRIFISRLELCHGGFCRILHTGNPTRH